jgi:hypothetical protein
VMYGIASPMVGSAPAPTSRRFMTLRLSMSGTMFACDTAEPRATTLRGAATLGARTDGLDRTSGMLRGCDGLSRNAAESEEYKASHD